MSKSGWFSPTLFTMIQPEPTLVPKCGACGLYKKCNSPKMPPSGAGEKGVLIVGEAPGADEDMQGRQFVGRSGGFLRKMLRRAGLSMDRDCRVTNALACRPPFNMIDDKRKVAYCRPAVLSEMRENDPSVIILLGGAAIESVIGHLWKEEAGGAKRWAGFKIPCVKPNVWICPTYHPSYIIRARPTERKLYEKVFLSHLQQAAKLVGSRPHDTVPDYKRNVEVLFDTDHAAVWLENARVSGQPVSFDYECLVPQTKVMTDDFRWVEIGSLKVGDQLTSFEEVPTNKSNWRKLVRGTVTAIKIFKAPCVRITFTDGRSVEASTNHPWLGRNANKSCLWLESGKLKPGDKIRQVTKDTWKPDNTREGGWLAGFFDGEGYVTNKVTVGFAQVDGPLFHKTMQLLKDRGFFFGSAEKKGKIIYKTRQRQMMGYCKGLQETLRFVGTIRPWRLLKNLQKSIFGNAALPRIDPFATVAKVEPVGIKEVVGVTMDTGTYIAEGLCSHNTDRLKPDSKDASIICAGVCRNGKKAIAFPWHGKAVAAMKRLLESDCPKIGANMKYEDRWSARMGIKVRNWVWDTMVMSHVIDSRKGISGLKFNAFVHLGVGDYDSRLKPYMKSKGGGNSPNKLREVDQRQLFGYCGEDALYTYLVAVRQTNILGIEGRF